MIAKLLTKIITALQRLEVEPDLITPEELRLASRRLWELAQTMEIDNAD